MQNYSTDLDYIVQKGRIGLTASHLKNLSSIYSEILDKNIIYDIAQELSQNSKDNFALTEQIHHKWASDHSPNFVAQIDSIIYKLNSDISADSIKEEMLDANNNFPNASNNLYSIWANNYEDATIIDDNITSLFFDYQNDDLRDSTNFAINKATCFSQLLAKANLAIEEVSSAKISEDVSEIQNHINQAKNYVHEFREINNIFSYGYSNETVLDDLLNDSIINISSKLQNAISEGMAIESQLLGLIAEV